MQVWAYNSALESILQGSGEAKNEQKVKWSRKKGLETPEQLPGANSERKSDQPHSLKVTCVSGVGSQHSEA